MESSSPRSTGESTHSKPSSSWQVLEQPSPSFVFPSSQASLVPGRITPSPHTAWQTPPSQSGLVPTGRVAAVERRRVAIIALLGAFSAAVTALDRHAVCTGRVALVAILELAFAGAAIASHCVSVVALLEARRRFRRRIRSPRRLRQEAGRTIRPPVRRSHCIHRRRSRCRRRRSPGGRSGNRRRRWRRRARRR